MKKKLLFILLTLVLLFTAACGGSQTEPPATPTPTSTPTPSPSPTPTPIPENLAETNLKAMTNMTKAALNSFSDRQIDVSNGIGCDMEGKFVFGTEFAELMGLSGISSVGFKGTMDFFDVLSMTGSLSLNDVSLIDVAFFTDMTNMYCNLPKYSEQFFVMDLTELETEDFDSEMFSEYSSLLQEQMSDKDALALVALLTTDLTACFEPETGIESNVNIGTGKYIITADRHTIRADADKLRAVAEEFISMTENNPAFAELSAEINPEDITDVIVYYYAGQNGTFAWELAPQEENAGSLVFVYTTNGFCLYGDDGNGAIDTLLYSETLSENSGKVTFPADLAVDNDIFTYTLGEDSLDVEGSLDEYAIAFSYTYTDTLVEAAISMSDSSMAVSCKATQEGNHMDMTMSIAEDEVEMGTFVMDFTYRDYQAAAAPANATDIDTWSASLDMNLALSDVFLFMSQYPELAELIESFSEGDDTVDFSGMTGYYADADGYVDFTPTEEDIVAMGIPSTGIDYIEITDDQISALVDYISNAYTDCYYDNYSYYNVSGNEYDGTVASTYLSQYLYYDAAAPDNCILLTFEAYSGSLVGLCVDAATVDDALVQMNALIATLGVDGTVTAEDMDLGIYVGDFYIYGFEEGTYYEILCIVSPE